MACTDILPKIDIKQIKVATIDPAWVWAMSKNADEGFGVSIAHNNIVDVDEKYLDNTFNLGEILEATNAASGFYYVKFFLTNDLQVYKLFKSLIKVITAYNSLYAGFSSGTNTNTKIKCITGTPGLKCPPQTLTKVSPNPNAKNDLDAAVAETKKCIKKLAAPDKPDPDDTGSNDDPPDNPAPNGGKGGGKGGGNDKKPEPTLKDRLIDALLDNKKSHFKFEDHVLTATRSFNVSTDKTKYSAEKGYFFEESQLSTLKYKDSQLKNLYFVMVPNVEYREDTKLIFTVRDYFYTKLLENFKENPPQTEAEEKTTPPQILEGVTSINIAGAEGVAVGVPAHNHSFKHDSAGNGKTNYSLHPDGGYSIHHNHEIKNGVVQQAASNCYPNCKKLHGVAGLPPHGHHLTIAPTAQDVSILAELAGPKPPAIPVNISLPPTVDPHQLQLGKNQFVVQTKKKDGSDTFQAFITAMSQGMNSVTKALSTKTVAWNDETQDFEEFPVPDDKALKSVLKSPVLVSEPLISYRPDNKITGLFYFNVQAVLDKILPYPQFNNINIVQNFNILQSVELYKFYKKDKTRKKIDSLKALTGVTLGLNDPSYYRLFRFDDDLEDLDFEYEIEATFLSPLSKIFAALLQTGAAEQASLYTLISNCDKLLHKLTSNYDNLQVIDPFTGVFTDDYLLSKQYVEKDQPAFISYLYAYIKITEFITGKTPIAHGASGMELLGESWMAKFVDIKPLQELRDGLIKITRAVEIAAAGNGIKFGGSSTPGTKKSSKGNSNIINYKRTIQKNFGNPKNSVYYDFMTQTPGFDVYQVTPDFLLNMRFPTEVATIKFFDAAVEQTTEADQIAPYVTVQSFSIEGLRYDVTETTLEKTEKKLQDVLLRAYLEKNQPELNTTQIKNPALELLSGLSVTVVDNEKVFDFKEIPSKTKLAGLTAKKTNLQKYASADSKSAEEVKKNKTLQDELSTNTFANAILIEDLDRLKKYTDVDYAGPAAITKKMVNDFPGFFAPQTRTAYAALGLLTKSPLAFLTKLMQVYEIQYLEGFEEGGLHRPKWTRISRQQISALASVAQSIICRLVPVSIAIATSEGSEVIAIAGNIQQAAVINDDFKIFNEHFLITGGLGEQMPSWDITETVSIVPAVVAVSAMPNVLSSFKSTGAAKVTGKGDVTTAAPAPVPFAIGGGGGTTVGGGY